MEIEYAAITYNRVILVQYAHNSGDFDLIINEILSKLSIEAPRSMFDQENHRFFLLHNSDGVNAIIASSINSDSSIAFGLLEEVLRVFRNSYPVLKSTYEPFSLQSDFEKQLKRLVTDRFSSKTKKIIENLEETQGIMMTALENEIMRGDLLNEVNYKAIGITDTASSFRREAQAVQLQVLFHKYRNYIVTAGIIVILLVLLYSLI